MRDFEHTIMRDFEYENFCNVKPNECIFALDILSEYYGVGYDIDMVNLLSSTKKTESFTLSIIFIYGGPALWLYTRLNIMTAKSIDFKNWLKEKELEYKLESLKMNIL